MQSQGRRKHLRVGQARSRRALARAQFINIHCITSFYELSIDDGKIAFFSQKIFFGKTKEGLGWNARSGIVGRAAAWQRELHAIFTWAWDAHVSTAAVDRNAMNALRLKEASPSPSAGCCKAASQSSFWSGLDPTDPTGSAGPESNWHKS